MTVSTPQGGDKPADQSVKMVNYELTKKDIKANPVLKEKGLKRGRKIEVKETDMQEGENVLTTYLRLLLDPPPASTNPTPAAPTPPEGEGTPPQPASTDPPDTNKGQKPGTGKPTPPPPPKPQPNPDADKAPEVKTQDRAGRNV